MGTERFPGQTEGIPADGFPCFHKTRISDELPIGSQQELTYVVVNLFFLCGPYATRIQQTLEKNPQHCNDSFSAVDRN